MTVWMADDVGNFVALGQNNCMSPQLPSSLQEILKKHQTDEFVGRQEHLSLFRENLELPLNNPGRRFVFSLFGQGGVGKSFLLRRLRETVERLGGLTAVSDETRQDVPSVLGHLADQMAAQGRELKNFATRYRAYLERRHELEADPEAPKGLPVLIGRLIGKGGLHLARRIPLGGAAFELIEDDAAADLLGDVASYVTRRLSNKDDVQLILKPVEVLTPLFLQDLQKVAADNLIGLFFDTYERTGYFLDEWLRDTFEGRHGSVAPNIVIVIAGQHELDKNLWAPYEGLVARLELELFTEGEAKEYLGRRGINDESAVRLILELSGRLPLLVAILGTGAPIGSHIAEPTDTAVKRFLKWVDEPEKRRVALDCSLLRHFNRDILSVVAENPNSSELFDWLIEMPFVLSRSEGWVYHSVVREQMIRQKVHETPEGCENLQEKISRYYSQAQEKLELSGVAKFRNKKWQSLRLDELYHRLCGKPDSQFQFVIVGYLAGLGTDAAFAREWAFTVQQAGHDIDSSDLEDLGLRLVSAVEDSKEKRYEDVAELFTYLLDHRDVPSDLRSTLLSQRALYFTSSDPQRALGDLEEALRLEPEQVFAWFQRGVVNEVLGRAEDAISDFDKVTRLSPTLGQAFLFRGRILKRLGRFDEALDDLQRSHGVDAHLKHAAWKEIGRIYLERKEAPEASAAFVETIHAYPACPEGWTGLIQAYSLTYQRLEIPKLIESVHVDAKNADVIGARSLAFGKAKFHHEALSGFSRAIELNNQIDWFYLNRGYAYFSLRDFEKALNDYDQVLSLDHESVLALFKRADVYREQERYDESLRDYERISEVDGETVWVRMGKARVYSDLRNYKAALEEADAAILLDDGEKAFLLRAEILIYFDRHDDALEEINKAVDIERSADSLASRGDVKRRLGRLEESLKDLDEAITLDGACGRAFYCRGLTKKSMGLYTEALDDIRHIIELDRSNEHRAQVELGNIFTEMNKTDKAINAFKKALMCEPDCDRSWIGLAQVLRKKHKPERVPALLRAMSFAKADRSSVFRSRGLALRRTGYLEEALVEFGKGIALDASDVWTIVERAETNYELGYYERMARDFERVFEIEPARRTQANINLGLALCNLGKYGEAIEVFSYSAEGECARVYNTAVARFLWKGSREGHAAVVQAQEFLVNVRENKRAISFYGLGGLEALEGHRDQAVDYLRQCLEINPNLKKWVKHDPAWRALHEDPGFQSIINDTAELPAEIEHAWQSTV
jgi:tetratricopeptide (TPR) repeat protein